VRLVRVYVSKDTFANAKCWAHGRRGNLEGSEGEICLHIENDDGSRKRDCQNGISGPRYGIGGSGGLLVAAAYTASATTKRRHAMANKSRKAKVQKANGRRVLKNNTSKM
jgi:hypothetical protein